MNTIFTTCERDVDNELKLLLNQYVHSVVSLKAVRSWVSDNIWDAQPDVDDSIDQVAISLIHLDDGIIDETTFRDLMMDRLSVFRYVEGDPIGVRSHPHAAATTNIIGLISTHVFPEYAVTSNADAVTSSALVDA